MGTTGEGSCGAWCAERAFSARCRRHVAAVIYRPGDRFSCLLSGMAARIVDRLQLPCTGGRLEDRSMNALLHTFQWASLSATLGFVRNVR